MTTASADNINRFIMAQERAKKIIQMDAHGELNKYKKNSMHMAESVLSDNSTTQPITLSQPITQPTSKDMRTIPSMGGMANKLPKEILESFKTKQIDPYQTHTQQRSILDEVNMMTNGELLKQEQTVIKPQPIVENVLPTQTAANNSNIDYSMIKMIVEECVRKYTSSLKKSIMNEAKLNSSNDELQALKIGDKFSFITKNGDLYEAKLTFVKNINKKG